MLHSSTSWAVVLLRSMWAVSPPPPHLTDIIWYIHSKSELLHKPFLSQLIHAGKGEAIRIKAILRSLVPVEDLVGVISIPFFIPSLKKGNIHLPPPAGQKPVNNVYQSGNIRLSVVFFPCIHRWTGIGARHVSWFLSWPQSCYGSFLGESLWYRGPKFSVVPARSWFLTRYESCCIAGDGEYQIVGDDWCSTQSWN